VPEELEVPTEHLQESIHEAAHGRHGHEKSFNTMVALSTAVLAVTAALAALFAGHAANDALFEQIEAANEWNHYQSKSIKSAVLNSKIALLTALQKQNDPKDADKRAEYDKDMEEIKSQAEAKEHQSSQHMHQHVVLARAVTFFQIAIALAAIAVLAQKRPLWVGSLALGAIGVVFFAMGLA
jgi:hypothetical protein